MMLFLLLFFPSFPSRQRAAGLFMCKKLPQSQLQPKSLEGPFSLEVKRLARKRPRIDRGLGVTRLHSVRVWSLDSRPFSDRRDLFCILIRVIPMGHPHPSDTTTALPSHSWTHTPDGHAVRTSLKAILAAEASWRMTLSNAGTITKRKVFFVPWTLPTVPTPHSH